MRVEVERALSGGPALDRGAARTRELKAGGVSPSFPLLMTSPQPEPPVGGRVWSPARWPALGLSFLALWWIFRRIDRPALWEALSHARPLWFAAAVGAFALALGLAAWRWHQMLRITGTVVAPGVTWRFTLVGHAFTALLMGAALSDVAKTALYSRRYGFPLERILAASALDRSAGVISTLLYGLAALALGVVSAPARAGAGLEWPSAGRVLGVCVAAGVVLAGLGVATRRWWRPAWARFGEEMLRAARALASRPATTAGAVAVGIAIQLLISSVLGCCLTAIQPGGVPWSRMLWTLPVVNLAGAMPVTLSGAGAREGAAILLWGAFGISAATAFSACLLTLCVNLSWAGVGVLVGSGLRRSPGLRSPAAERGVPA
ncbi:MAG TPA: hypothetical protein DCM86_09980 [Verrucomicrobiales bacterium]|nr:hypothetical protein [Verrucomicrobiales bacterium]